MKISCAREALLHACHAVAPAVAARTTKPILSNIKMIAEADVITLMATDLELGIRYELRGPQIQKTGSCILPVTKLVSILRESTDEEVLLEAQEEQSTIRLSRSKFVLPGASPDDFPDLPETSGGDSYLEISAGVLRTLIHRTVFAADRKESARWAITGVLWEFHDDHLRLVATDTRRVAIADGPAQLHGEKTSPKISHLLPAKAINLLDRSLSDEGELIRVYLMANEAMIQLERATIHTRLVEGRFPPYRDIIPKKQSNTLQLPAAEFFAKVRQAAITSDEESKRVDIRFEPGKITLRSSGSESGSSDVNMDLENYSGEPTSIALNAQYLTEMFRAVEGEPTIALDITNDTLPAVFKIADHYLYLVMPLANS